MQAKKKYKRGDPVTVERLEAALDNCAAAIFLHKNGALIMPIYERLERELENLRVNEVKLRVVRARGQLVVAARNNKSRIDFVGRRVWSTYPQKQWQ